MVHDSWTVYDSFLSLPERIARCTHMLTQWAGTRFRSIPSQIKRKRAKLISLKHLEHWSSESDNISDLELDLERLCFHEESYWRRRSRANWMTLGDRNSKFFHAKASARRTRNHLRGLVSYHKDLVSDTQKQ